MSDRVVELPRQSAVEFERTPPQDIAAEQSVLGGMLLSKDAIADVVEVVRSTDFYRPAHQTIFDVVLDLYGRGEPADPITVSGELTRTGELGRVGGAPYLHTLLSSVPTAANAGYYARIVAEQAVLRRLVEAGTRIVQLGYATGGGELDDIVDRAQQAVYDVTERRTSEDYTLLEQLMQPTMDELEAIGSRGGSMTGVPTGFADLDTLTNGLHPGQLVIIAARPGIGKSTLGLDVARSCSVKHGMTSAIFSLEMSKTEITMRLLSAEARVPLHHMRSGMMTDDDWARLARRMGEVADAPLFIDDSPNLSMMEIRSKARRLKQRHDLRLVVVDYLQLMQGNKRAESRQQEVSELSRSLKLLAKELDCPVMAMSQLNRGPEQRTDKKPMLSDLRESGCLPAGTRILRADTGAETTIRELFAGGATDVPVWSLDDSLRYVRRHVTSVFATGRREVFRLRLASGKSVTATANHPFLTYDGWRALGDVAVGTRLAVPRHVPAPEREAAWSLERVVLLAHLLAAGQFHPGQPVRCAVAGPAGAEAVRAAASAFGLTVVSDPAGGLLRLHPPVRPRRPGPARHPLLAWLDQLGLLDAPQVGVPAAVAGLPKAQVRLFLRHLWAAAGSLRAAREAPGPAPARIQVVLPTALLADGVSRLLLRFGISTVLAPSADGRWLLDVVEPDDQRRFLREVGMHGSADEAVRALLDALSRVDDRTGADTVPADVWQRVRQVLAERAEPTRPRVRVGARPAEPLTAVAATLGRTDLDLVATNDVLWDRVVAVEPLGVQEVYDATVAGTHNFVADGVVVHNSIEQDADLVVLLHREDAYEKESPRAGEADFIVAKHRNGPTSTVTVAFQGHYSRFVDMSSS